MIRVQYAVLAQFLRPLQGGAFDVLGFFDTVTVPRLPVVMDPMVLVVLLTADKEDDFGEKPLRLKFTSPSGKPILQLDHVTEVQLAPGSWMAAKRININLRGIQFHEAGAHLFTLDIEGVEVAWHPLRVIVRQPDESQA